MQYYVIKAMYAIAEYQISTTVNSKFLNWIFRCTVGLQSTYCSVLRRIRFHHTVQSKQLAPSINSVLHGCIEYRKRSHYEWSLQSIPDSHQTICTVGDTVQSIQIRKVTSQTIVKVKDFSKRSSPGFLLYRISTSPY